MSGNNLLLELITTQRDHLFDISKALSLALADVSKKTGKAIALSVGGTDSGGKKIFPDAAKDAVLGFEVHLRGEVNRDEIWERDTDSFSKDVCVAFINTFFLSGYGSLIPELSRSFMRCEDNEERRHFVGTLFVESLKKRPGLIFVHNSRLFSEQNADVCIWVESHASKFEANEREQQRYCQDGEVSRLFSQFGIHSKYDWTRYVRIEIKNPGLVQNPAVIEALSKLKNKQGVFCPQQQASASSADYPYMPRL